MLALRTWFGQDVPVHNNNNNNKYVCAFSKLGNVFLGKLILHVEPSPETLVDTIRNLQQQAARLLPHPTRPAVYMQIWLGHTLLPLMTYSEMLDAERVEQALHSLHSFHSKQAFCSGTKTTLWPCKKLRNTTTPCSKAMCCF